jgi:hypothetical protein
MLGGTRKNGGEELGERELGKAGNRNDLKPKAKSQKPYTRYFRPFSDSLYMYLMEGL